MRAARCLALWSVCAVALLAASAASAADAPAWLHALAAAPVPPHDDKADALQLLAETELTVRSDGRIRRLERAAYLILRPEGRSRGKVMVDFDAQTKILSLRGWSIPSSGKDFAVRESDAVESALPGIENGELASDVRAKLLLIPGAQPGSVIGYEYEQEQRPYFMGDEWDFQQTVPVREARYTLTLPTGWSYRAAWVRHESVEPATPAPGQWRWVVSGEPEVPMEERMPPWRGVAARMVLTILPPGGGATALDSWKNLGDWYSNLTRGRRDPSPEIRSRVAALVAGLDSPLERIEALAHFVQTDIRYVALEFGIGGHQPHPATDVFQHHYGDCKDKATLLSSMLREIGVESYYVVVNTARGAVTQDSPPSLTFDHVILAIALPDGVDLGSLPAVVAHPRLGKLLYFDPTDETRPLGGLIGALQNNYGLLVTPDGGELVQLPQLKPEINTIQRTMHVKLDEEGGLSGTLVERRSGDPAAEERNRLRNLTRGADRTRHVEVLLADSIPNYEIRDAKVINADSIDGPLEWQLEIGATHYGKVSGDLLLVRPRLVGSKSSALLERREARLEPVEFARPQRDSDVFEIELPPHYKVDETPAPANAEYPFGSYHSRTEVVGRTLRYTRTLEIRQLSVPPSQAEDLKKFYRVIATDEGRTAVLTATPH